ncbi:hypothetical protein HA402_002596 [Bradysia odoriphaga]|nr:hypothetical protein HA402_002596 [Bradysia odoriphaga]
MVQQVVAGMTAWKSIVQSALPCMMILFYGAWSDRHGRRLPCILMPIFGELTTVLGLICCTYFKSASVEVVGITDALFPGLSGGWFTMLMGVFSYMGDVTTEESRTVRIGIANLCFTLGIPIGTAISGILLRLVGFYGIFSLSATLYIIAIVYGLTCVREARAPTKPKQFTETDEVTQKSLVADFFDTKHVVDTFKVALKSGPNKRRLRVVLLMVSLMVVIGPVYGEMSVFYLFTRYRFNWSEIEFSLFSAYGTVTGLLGTIFAVGVFSHKLKIDDAFIGIMASVSKILSSFIYAFAVTEWQLYLGPLVEIFSGTSFTAMRSIATKLVEKDELGKVNSLIGAAEALMPLVYMPMYAFMYKATIHTFPGAFFFAGSALLSPTVFIFLWLYKMKKRDLKTGFNESDKVASSRKVSQTLAYEMEHLNPKTICNGNNEIGPRSLQK